MSEKKAPEKKEKEKLVHVTEEQLKAGKEEIMKIVNGQQRSWARCWTRAAKRVVCPPTS